MNRKITAFTFAAALFTLAGISAQAQMLPQGHTPLVSIMQANAQQSPLAIASQMKLLSLM